LFPRLREVQAGGGAVAEYSRVQPAAGDRPNERCDGCESVCEREEFLLVLANNPQVRSSNQVTQAGQLNRQSRPLTCSLLTQSMLQLSQAGDHMVKFYQRVRGKECLQITLGAHLENFREHLQHLTARRAIWLGRRGIVLPKATVVSTRAGETGCLGRGRLR
jgi:hypothetical protein